MECDNCGTFIDQGLSKCPTCGAVYRRRQGPYLGLLQFCGGCCLMFSAFVFFNKTYGRSYLPITFLTSGFGIGCLVLHRVLFQRTSYRWLGGEKVGEIQDFPNFNSDFCAKTIRTGASACVILVGTAIALLVTSKPGNGRCGDWTQQQLQAWTGYVIMGGLWAAWISFIAIRWKWFYRRSIDTLMWRLENREKVIGGSLNPRDFQADQTFVLVSIGSALFCAMPLLSMLVSCVKSSGAFNLW